MNFRLRALAFSVYATMAAALPATTATLTAPANDFLSGASDANAFLPVPSFNPLVYSINTAGASGENGEPYGNGYPGSLWLRVSSPFNNGINLAFASYLSGPAGNYAQPGFNPQFNIYAIPSGSTPSFPLSAAVQNAVASPVTDSNGTRILVADFTINSRPESDYLVRVLCVTGQAFANLSVTVAPDIAPPQIGISTATPTSGTVAVDSATFQFTGSALEAPFDNSPRNPSSGLRRVEWRVDEGTIAPATLATTERSSGVFSGEWTAGVTVGPGQHLFQVRAVDGAGNVSPWAEAIFTRTGVPDSIAPTLTVEGATPTSGPVAADSSNFDFSGFAADGTLDPLPAERTSGLARVEFRVDEGTVLAAAVSTYWDPEARLSLGTWSARATVGPGSHRFEARAVDAAGNVSPWSDPVTFVRTTPATPPAEPRDAAARDTQSFAVDDAAGTGWIGGTYYVDQAALVYDGASFGPGTRAYALNSRGWPINIVYDLAGGAVTGLLSLPAR